MMVDAESFSRGAVCAGALLVIAAMATSGCAESSRPRAKGSGAAAGVSGSVSGSGGDAGADDGGVSGAGGTQSGASGAGGTQGGASGAGGTQGGASGAGGTQGGASGTGGATGGAESDGGNGGAAGNPGGGGITAGGEAGEAGAPGTALEPVRVIRGDPDETTWWDLMLQGVDLGAYDGKTVTARIGHPERPPERLGSGQTRVQDGSFSLFFPEVWESSLYKYKRAYIDVNENGSCDAADLVFHDARATPDFVMTVRNPDAERAPADLPLSTTPEADCEVFNSMWPVE